MEIVEILIKVEATVNLIMTGTPERSCRGGFLLGEKVDPFKHNLNKAMIISGTCNF
jgi:hypothetical protein